MIASLPAGPSLLAHHPNTIALALQLAAVTIVLALLTWGAWRGLRRRRTYTETFAPMRDEADVDG